MRMAIGNIGNKL